MDTNIFLWQSDRWCTRVEPSGDQDDDDDDDHNHDGGDHNHDGGDDYDDDCKYGYD